MSTRIGTVIHIALYIITLCVHARVGLSDYSVCMSVCMSVCVSVDSGREILRKHFVDPETMIKTQL